jgi:hypothetical protein
MTRKLSYTRLSKSRFEGLKLLSAGWKTAAELGRAMWGDHRMATLNARAIVRELLLADLILAQRGEVDRFTATEKAKPILKNPSWICRYCSLDTTDSNKRLWPYPCLGCPEHHYVCRFCKKPLLKPVGEFPYAINVRGCPGTVQIPKRPERKPRKEKKPEQDPVVANDLWRR